MTLSIVIDELIDRLLLPCWMVTTTRQSFPDQDTPSTCLRMSALIIMWVQWLPRMAMKGKTHKSHFL